VAEVAAVTGSDSGLPNELAAALELSPSTALNSCDSGYEPGAAEEDALDPVQQQPELHQQTIYINGLAHGGDDNMGGDTQEGGEEADVADVVLLEPTAAAPTSAAAAAAAEAEADQHDLEVTLSRGMLSRAQGEQGELEVTLGRGMHSHTAGEQGGLEVTLGRGMHSRTQSLPSSQPSLAFSSYLDQVAAEFEPESSDAEDMLGQADM
jgi:hypothetical protein